jgi:multiple sugar transport system permease protein
MKSAKRLRKFVKMFVLGLIAFICLIPFILIFFTSIKERVVALSMPPVWFFVPTLRNYVDLLTNVIFLKAILNSLLISSASTVIAMIIGVLAGYGFSRFRFKGKGFFTYMILALRMVPSIVFIIPYFVIWRTIRLNDTHLSMILMYLTLCLPLIILMMRSFVVDVPVELEEAAMVDGCSRWQTLRLILVPALRPGILAAATLAFIALWNDFILAMFNTGRNTRTLTVEIYTSLSFYQLDWNKLSTSAVIAVIPAIIFISLTQKYIVRGLTMGAIKG